MMKKAWHKYLQILQNYDRGKIPKTEVNPSVRSQKYRFKQANRNAVLLLIGQGKRISLKTNLVSEKEHAIFSKGRQFSKTTPFLGMQNPRMNSPHGDLGQYQVWNGAISFPEPSFRSVSLFCMHATAFFNVFFFPPFLSF